MEVSPTPVSDRRRRSSAVASRDRELVVFVARHGAVWVTTEKFGGSGDAWFGQREGTRTREREFIVLPDQIKHLGVGEAALIQPGQKQPARVIRVFPPLEGRRHG